MFFRKHLSGVVASLQVKVDRMHLPLMIFDFTFGVIRFMIGSAVI